MRCKNINNQRPCAKCKKLLPFSSFGKNRRLNSGLHGYCRDCVRIKSKIYKTANKEKIATAKKDYYKRRKEYIKEREATTYRRIITTIFDILGNRCALCGNTNKQVLQIDHINGGGSRHHRSKGHNKVYQDVINSCNQGNRDFRLLCANCNVSEGIRLGFKKSIWR